MKVLWLAHAIPYPPKAGFLLRSYNLLRELARDHTVDLIAFVQEPWLRTLFPTVEEGLAESRAALGAFCRNVTFLPIESVASRWGKHITAAKALVTGDSYSARWLVSENATRIIGAQIESTAYDIVHFDTIGLAPYRTLAKNAIRTLTHHNIESHMMLRRADNVSNPIAKRYFRHEGELLRDLEIQSANDFAAHITCSELDSVRLKEFLPQANTVTVPNGVDCDYFNGTANIKQRPNSLIFVGTMNWYPNVDAVAFFLKEVWPRLKQRAPDLTFDVAGSNPPESIVALGKSLPGVTVHGFVPDVRPMIDSAAIFVCPIRDGGGTKLKILDAYAMRKCVVAHPIACEGIEVTPDQDVIFATTPDEYIERIVSLLADEPRRKELGQAARKLVEDRYSFRAIGAEFSASLENLVRRSSRNVA